jgi:hypothetical protein
MKALLPLAILLSTAAVLPAQAPPPRAADAATTTVQSLRERPQVPPRFRVGATQTAPELYPGESADVGPQYLLIQQMMRRSWVEGALDVQYYYTSNALLTERDKQGTGLLVSTAWAAFAPTPFKLGDGELAIRAGYREQMYNYGLDSTQNQLNNLDFNVSTVFAGARWLWREQWIFGLGAEYNRFLSHQDDWNEFYTELLLAWGVERVFSFSERTQLSLAYAGGYHWTHTDPIPTSDVNNRLDTILSVTLTQELLSRLLLQPFYRFQVTHYTESSTRTDIYNTVGVSLSYLFTEWASVRIFASYEVRNSNDDSVQDFQNLNAGGGITFAVRF